MRKIFVDHQQVYGNNYSVIIDDFILSKTKKKYIINSRWDKFSKFRKDFKSVTKLKEKFLFLHIKIYKNITRQIWERYIGLLS